MCSCSVARTRTTSALTPRRSATPRPRGGADSSNCWPSAASSSSFRCSST
jgi:hypothetical protein